MPSKHPKSENCPEKLKKFILGDEHLIKIIDLM